MKRLVFLFLFFFTFLSACTHVESGQPQVSSQQKGQPAPEAGTIESLVKPKLSDLNACYKEEQRRNPKASGKVMFSFVILKNGRTAEVRLLASTLKSPVMEGCLVGKMEAWQFPVPSDGQELRVRYPFSFEP